VYQSWVVEPRVVLGQVLLVALVWEVVCSSLRMCG
jgi:hypothetical protein